ncbi:Tic22 family protein [Leptothoe sp. PORK10 BA2]|uniref:Tic22 family protein n=1 Tax=Leptothoe sp. PORK10 BA2 TaxID=3110254 RepID=UPI002B21930F|nr:Tic22 family protein [Leptothoe sp. PORK10 BA2]MEA5463956.1 Tic22 family protein [Leptothoe sp. PORK10 BA2]
MKAFKALLGFCGGCLLAAGLPMQNAIAISEEDLLEKFGQVSVFVLSDGAGGYVTTRADLPNDGLGDIDLLQVFFNEDDAKKLGEQVRQANADFRENGVVGIASLATIHLSAAEQRDNPLKVVFVPQEEDLEAAQALDPAFLEGANNAASIVPLFGIQNGDGDFIGLSFGDSDEQIIGMFFSSSDAMDVLAAVNEAQPGLQAQLGVVSLGNFTQLMLNSDDEVFERVMFLQSEDVVNSNQSLVDE